MPATPSLRRPPSVRSSPAIARYLRFSARGIDTVLITGTITNIYCKSSARDAHSLGFRVVMAADANAARRDQDHNAALHNIYRSFGDMRPTDEVLDLLGVGGLPGLK